MYGSSHFLAGACIYTLLEHNPVLGAGLAFASHALMDIVPEQGMSTENMKKQEILLILFALSVAWFTGSIVPVVIGGLIACSPDIFLILKYTGISDKFVKYHTIWPWHKDWWPVLPTKLNFEIAVTCFLIFDFVFCLLNR